MAIVQLSNIKSEGAGWCKVEPRGVFLKGNVLRHNYGIIGLSPLHFDLMMIVAS